jgi:hypothetical protein
MLANDPVLKDLLEKQEELNNGMDTSLKVVESFLEDDPILQSLMQQAQECEAAMIRF